MKSLAIVTAVASLALLASTAAQASVVYDSLPAGSPGNIVSLGYQATSTREFGQEIVLAGTDRTLTNVVVGLSSWAKKSDYPLVGDATTFTHPLTLNLFQPGNASGPGALVASKTITATIAYRPEVYGFNGIYTTATFDFSADNVTLPDGLVATLAYNTQTYGAAPIGAPGPYNSLNFGLNEGAPSVGSLANADVTYWNTSHAPFYSDDGAGGVGTLRQDTGWTGYAPTLQINAVPEPTTLAAVAAGALVLLGRRRRKA